MTAFVVEMVKLILTFHGRTFCSWTFSGQGVSFADVSGPGKSGRFVGLLTKICHMRLEPGISRREWRMRLDHLGTYALRAYAICIRQYSRKKVLRCKPHFAHE